MDQYAFILGMITAFSECVAGGCKRMALSPPLTPALFARVSPEACDIIEKHGLIHYHERNEELPEDKRFEWLIIAARQEYRDRFERKASPLRAGLDAALDDSIRFELEDSLRNYYLSFSLDSVERYTRKMAVSASTPRQRMKAKARYSA